MEPISVPSRRSGTRAVPMLDTRIIEAIRQRGFEYLSEAQERAIPPILEGGHVLLIAPTGTGKTESAMIPVFQRLLEGRHAGIGALYITPLRSLNRDILARMEWWCRRLGLAIGVRHGDTPSAERRKQALSPPDLLITTPETLQAMFMGSRLKKSLEHVRFVVVDEIHELAGSKRGAQLSIALERLVERAGEFQRIGLSATVGNPEGIARLLCGGREATVIEIPASPHLSIMVRYAGDDFRKQAAMVSECIGRHPSSLVFVNTRVTAEALGHQLYERGDVEVHHGSLSKEVRIEAEDRFKQGLIRSLICTSSMELGIDIGHVDHIVQFGSPREVARLIQRVGRAGHRLHTISKGTVLTTGFDDLLESLVIAGMALSNRCEEVRTHTNAADVLANQIAAMAVEYGEISRLHVERIVGRSSCFTGVGAMVKEVCEQMVSHRLVRLEGDTIRRTSRTRRYLTENLSMIHDERKMSIFDIVSRRTVGTLDESFVIGWIQAGAIFITKGQLWRVLDMEGERITVEPASRVKGELPSWEGEQIPVPFMVAQEVGRLRRTGAMECDLLDDTSLQFARDFLSRAASESVAIPSDRLITLESLPEGVICNICAGHKVNEAIGRALSILLSARFGTSVGIEVGAYHILLRLPSSIGPLEVEDVLRGLQPGHIEGVLKLALKRTALFRWKLVQIAKKFGAIEKNADLERMSLTRLMEGFEGTIVAHEAYRELFTEYMDVEGAARVLGAIGQGEVEIRRGRLSPFGREGLFSSRDLIPPPSGDQAVLGALKRRIEQEEIVLSCLHCRRWKSRTVVQRVPERPVCPECGARLIAALKPFEEGTIPRKGRGRTEEEKTAFTRVLRNANLVLSHGRKAVIALAGRGIGPETAARILATLAEGDMFYREIMKAERNYVRTHRFW
ncbi:MAG: DEAD/DEAH box helicase [Methanomicrobiales archaeon]|nr:DEAD/DEAH box helicase [Methanomicrobiales archaeon]